MERGGTCLAVRAPSRHHAPAASEGDLIAVDVRTDGGLRLSAPRVVTRRARDFSPDYGVFPDDQSFPFMEAEGDRSRFIMVLNFFEELKSRVPN